jgi:hypothetical protein
MLVPIVPLLCLPPPPHIDLCITMPGNVTICAMDLLNAADPYILIQTLFQGLNSALAPLTPIFDIIDVAVALVQCIQAIPQCLAPPDPEPLIKCIPILAAAIAKLVQLVPQLSVPIMILEIVKALIVAVTALITRLEVIILKNAQLLVAVTAAAQPGNIALKAVVDCATGNIAIEIHNLNASLAPLNRLIGIINVFAAFIPGVPNPLIPSLADLGADAAAAIAPLQNVVDILSEIVSFLPVP